MLLRYVWASPNTVLGILLGLLGTLGGSRFQFRRGCVEFYGGILSSILKILPPNGARAITLGHTIVGCDLTALDNCRFHEHVHVRQYERWGPMFLVAYLGCSAYLWIRRRDYYYENPFEIEAFSKEEEYYRKQGTDC